MLRTQSSKLFVTSLKVYLLVLAPSLSQAQTLSPAETFFAAIETGLLPSIPVEADPTSEASEVVRSTLETFLNRPEQQGARRVCLDARGGPSEGPAETQFLSESSANLRPAGLFYGNLDTGNSNQHLLRRIQTTARRCEVEFLIVMQAFPLIQRGGVDLITQYAFHWSVDYAGDRARVLPVTPSSEWTSYTLSNGENEVSFQVDITLGIYGSGYGGTSRRVLSTHRITDRNATLAAIQAALTELAAPIAEE